MIKKLMKYDLKKMTNLLIYLYPITILMAGITRLINIGKEIQLIFIIGQIFAGITYSLVANILVNTFVQILTTFNRSFYKDESYLTHTLPVSKKQLIASKYLSALTVIFASVLVSVVSLVIVLYTNELGEMIKSFINLTISGLNIPTGTFITIIVVLLFAQICCMISMAFTVIVKANTYQEKRVLKGLGWFAGLYLGIGAITLMLGVLMAAITGDFSSVFAEVIPARILINLIILAGVLYLLYSILFYLACNKLFAKGVNVD